MALVSWSVKLSSFGSPADCQEDLLFHVTNYFSQFCGNPHPKRFEAMRLDVDPLSFDWSLNCHDFNIACGSWYKRWWWLLGSLGNSYSHFSSTNRDKHILQCFKELTIELWSQDGWLVGALCSLLCVWNAFGVLPPDVMSALLSSLSSYKPVWLGPRLELRVLIMAALIAMVAVWQKLEVMMQRFDQKGWYNTKVAK